MHGHGTEQHGTAAQESESVGIVAPVAVALAGAIQWVLANQTLYVSEWQSPVATWNLGTTGLVTTLLVLLAGIASFSPEGAWQRRPIRHPLRLLAGILVVGLALRLYTLNEMPPGFFQDEAINGNDAIALGQRHGWELWSFSISGRPTLFLYMVLGALKLFGRSYLALKVVPIAIGLATIVAVYALAAELFSARVALWAAFLLATARWHVHYSRMAWEAICVPLFATLAFLFLVRGLRARSDITKWFALSGAMLAAGLYTYAGFRAIPLALLFFILVYAVARPHPFVRRLRFMSALPCVLVALTAPLISFAVTHPADWWGRYREVAVDDRASAPLWSVIVQQVAKSALSMNHVGDALVRHNLPLAPQLDPITGTAFLLGLALLVRSGPRLARALLAVWSTIVLLLVATTGEAPHATRLLALLVPVIMIAAVGCAFAAEVLAGKLPRAGQRVVGIAVISAIAALNSYTYFVTHAADPGVEQGFNILARGLCDRVAGETGASVFWTEDIAYWARPQCEYLAPNVNLALDDVTVPQLLDGHLLSARRPLVFIVGANAIATSGGAIRVGPSGIPTLQLQVTPDVVRNRAGQPFYYYYRLE